MTIELSKGRPLYLNDEQLAVAVLGTARANEWPAIAQGLKGFPPVNSRMGGRFWPDVVEYFSQMNAVDKFNEGLARRMREDALEQKKRRRRE
jgi:hypothetical protein